MHDIPSTLWQRPLEGAAEPRFSVGLLGQTTDEICSCAALKNNLGENETDPVFAREFFESLRADVTVALFNDLTAASIAHPYLAPFLMDALDCALETLLLFEHQYQLCAVQEWLTQGRQEQKSNETAPQEIARDSQKKTK